MKALKKLLCLVLALMMVIMCACTNNTKNAVVEYKVNGKTVGSLDTGFMYFWISFQKNIYAPVAQSYEDGWQHVVNKETGEDLYDLLLTEAKESAKRLLAIEYMHDTEYNLEISDERKDTIDAQIDSYIKMYGSKAAFESELSKYGADINTLKRYFELMLKQNAVNEHLCGAGGLIVIPENELKEYFGRKYAIADDIFFSIVSTKADGTVVSLSEEEIEAKKAIANEVYNRIVSLGEDFDTLKQEYNEDVFAPEYYPHGFFVTYDSTFPTEFVNAVFADTEAEIVFAETPNTGFHIIKRLPMDKELYNAYPDVYDNLVTAAKTEALSEIIAEKANNAYVNEELLLDYNPEVIPEFKLGG